MLRQLLDKWADERDKNVKGKVVPVLN